MKSSTKTKLKAEIKERIKGFKINKIPKYFDLNRYKNRISYYYHLDKYYNYLDKFKFENLNLGLVKGGEETYIFDINDTYIPSIMYTTKETYSKLDIDLFFKLSSKKFKLKHSSNDIFLDIGANIGTTSVYVSKNIKPHLSILAFEPDKLNYKLLLANSIINSCTDFNVENLALSDKEGIANFFVDQENRGASKIVKNNNEFVQESHRIQTIRFDDYIKKSRIEDRIKYIWMDVEGHEPYALNGMKKFLASHKLPLYMEFSPSLMNNYDFNLLYNLLSIVYSGFYKIKSKEKEVYYKEYKINKLKNMFDKKCEQCNIMLF